MHVPSYIYVNNNLNSFIGEPSWIQTSYGNIYGLFDGITLVQQCGT